MMEEMKKQASELIEQAYQRGFNTGYEKGKFQTWSEEVKKYEIEPDKKNEYIKQGRNEAWEAVRKIYLSIFDGGLTTDEIIKIFGNYSCLNDIPKKFSASEAIEKLRKYEEQTKEKDEKSKEFKVGDVIKMNGHSAVITWCNGDRWSGICIQRKDNGVSEVGMTYGMTYQGMTYDGWTKIGETIPEIMEVLKKSKEGE